MTPICCFLEQTENTKALTSTAAARLKPGLPDNIMQDHSFSGEAAPTGVVVIFAR